VLSGAINTSEYDIDVYVLNIGMHLLPLLRSVYYDIRFIEFHRVDQLPKDAVEIILPGIGMPQFKDYYNEMDNSFGLSANDNPFYKLGNMPTQSQSKNIIPSIRQLVYQRLNLGAMGNNEPYEDANSSKQYDNRCILLISRETDRQYFSHFAARSNFDRLRENLDMRAFHFTGEHVYTSMHYSDSTAGERRSILNEDALVAYLRNVYIKHYCFKFRNFIIDILPNL
jgi:hypothetical protein